MGLIARNQRRLRTIRENRINIPNVQVSIVHRASNYAPRLLRRHIPPGQTVKPAPTRQSKPKEREKDFRSVASFAVGASSKAALSALSRSRSHISSSLSWEKLASTAPAIVPEAMSGLPRAGLQAKVALRVICFNWTIVGHGPKTGEAHLRKTGDVASENCADQIETSHFFSIHACFLSPKYLIHVQKRDVFSTMLATAFEMVP